MAVSDWMAAYKKRLCKNFKNVMDDNFKKVEEFFKETK